MPRARDDDADAGAGSYDGAWQFRVVVGALTGLVQIVAGGPRRADGLGRPAYAPG